MNHLHSNANTFNGVITIKELIEVLGEDSETMQKVLRNLREKRWIQINEIFPAKKLVKNPSKDVILQR